MTPDQFIKKWQSIELKERSAAQSHFIDLCKLLDEPAPTDVDMTGDWFCFEKGASKSTGGEGWADVWKKNHFGWEYKGKRRNLQAAFAQLQQYALALENPPLLIVCDMDRIEIHTNWTNSVSEVFPLQLEDLREPKSRQLLKWAFTNPDKLKPAQTRQSITEKAAAEFAKLAQQLRQRGNKPEEVAHFINRLVFCMFAEDVDLLPNNMFKRLLERASKEPGKFADLSRGLFAAMKSGGDVGFESVKWFNGGLFDDDKSVQLNEGEIALTLKVADLDWAEIDPSIFGTLFERGLDPDKRSQLGAHYTDREKIEAIVEQVIAGPLLTDWEDRKLEISKEIAKAEKATGSARTKFKQKAASLYKTYLEKLRAFRVLDPACGSGNFLYLALHALKDLEHRAGIEAEVYGILRELPQIGPSSVKGIEINSYAAELARVTIWIGEIQWMRRNGFGAHENPILQPLQNIENRDAILSEEGKEPEWPEADVIIGNPPFLGDKKMKDALGDAYVDALRAKFQGRVSGGADLVTYWFEKAGSLCVEGKAVRFGFVATNGIRFGKNREILDRHLSNGLRIYNAISDDEWTVDGADVRVSIVCMDVKANATSPARLDGAAVDEIFSNLTGGPTTVDVTTARSLPQNKNRSFFGFCLAGPFGLKSEEARELLRLPKNVNGRPNSDVVKPLWNGVDVLRRHQDRWVIDFGVNTSEEEAALYESPFQIVETRVKPIRLQNKRPARKKYWWRHGETRPGLRKATADLSRWLITPETSKYRIFRWLPKAVAPEHSLIVIARDDDTTFGILQSRFHVIWVTAQGNHLGVGNDLRYNSTRTFDTFPFPVGLTPDIAAAIYADDPRAINIADAARKLDVLRETWLNPSDIVDRVPEAAEGFPDQIKPKVGQAASLKKRTVTKLYNAMPAWLTNAHAELDKAVAQAYGWPADISDEAVLANLLELNERRVEASNDATSAVFPQLKANGL